MFRITRDPSPGSFIQSLAKITVMVLSCPLTWTRSVLRQHICPWCVCVLPVAAILNISKYITIILIVSTNYIFVHLLDNKVF